RRRARRDARPAVRGAAARRRAAQPGRRERRRARPRVPHARRARGRSPAHRRLAAHARMIPRIATRYGALVGVCGMTICGVRLLLNGRTSVLVFPEATSAFNAWM